MSYPRQTLALGIALAVASPMAWAQSIKPMDPSQIARLGSTSPAPIEQSVSQAPQLPQAPSRPAVAPVPSPAVAAAPVATTPAAVPPPRWQTTTIPAGSRLSDALETFVRTRGWSMRWLIEEDYMLDADLPIPATDVIEAVTWVVQTYQRQGGMRGVVPRFARGNQVVAIQKMDVRDVE